jgi:hypothetical protein
LGICGLSLISLSLIYGFIKGWQAIASPYISLTAGVLLAVALPMFLGFQMLMNALLLDIQSVPRTPLCEKLVFSGEHLDNE